MGVLEIILVVALLLTCNYGSVSDPANYAICSFRQLKKKQA